jgi:hypothetical protein
MGAEGLSSYRKPFPKKSVHSGKIGFAHFLIASEFAPGILDEDFIISM